MDKTATEMMMKDYAKTRIRAASEAYSHATFDSWHDHHIAEAGFEAGAEWAMAQIAKAFTLTPKLDIGQIAALGSLPKPND